MILKTQKGVVILLCSTRPTRLLAKQSRISFFLKAESGPFGTNYRNEIHVQDDAPSTHASRRGDQRSSPRGVGRRGVDSSLIKWVKWVVPHTTPSTLILSAGLYLVAVCTALERQQGYHWLSLLLEAKMPGLTTPCQETSWESFENIMRGYINREGYHEHVQIDLSKSRALLRLGSPWNKQVRKAFMGLFLDQSTPFASNDKEAAKRHTNQTNKDNLDSEKPVLPWYRIDACTSPSHVIWSSRVDSNLKTGNTIESKGIDRFLINTSASKDTGSVYTSNPLLIEGIKKQSRVTDSMLPSGYLLPSYTNISLAFVNNDSIPAKLDSPYNPLYKEVPNLSLFDGTRVARGYRAQQGLNPRGCCLEQEAALDSNVLGCYRNNLQETGRDVLLNNSTPWLQGKLADRLQMGRERSIGKEWARFQDAVKEAFYSYGLLPIPNWGFLYDSVVPTQSIPALDMVDLERKDPSYQRGDDLSEADEYEQIVTTESTIRQSKEEGDQRSSREGDPLNGFEGGVFSRLSASLLGAEREDDALKQGSRHNYAATSEADNLLECLHVQTGEELLDSQKALNTEFLANELLSNRFMSGYKFPELTQSQTRSLYTQYAVPRAFISFWRSLSMTQLQDVVTQAPLRVVLPPGLPYSFCKKICSQEVKDRAIYKERALSREADECFGFQSQTLSTTPVGSRGGYAQDNSKRERDRDVNRWKDSNVLLSYRPICLGELEEVVQAFDRNDRDYKSYLNQPKDTPSAIRISPSLEDDQLIKLRYSQAPVEDDPTAPPANKRPTKLERLKAAQRRGLALEKAKELQTFAYKNKLALYPTADNYDISSPNNLDLNSWIVSRLGHANMLSDRKHTFFGRLNVLPKRLVAKEQKDVNKQILGGIPLRQDHQDQESLNKRGVEPLPDLQARARRDLIYLLDEPNLKARDASGFEHRNHTQDPRLSKTQLRLTRSHTDSFWQRKKMRSTLLGAPSRRYAVMPAISQSDWEKIVEWQVKEYIHAEEKRLKPHIQKDPDKTFKIKRINVYLPWAILRTPLEKPFEWPVTRLDFEEGETLCHPQHTTHKSRLVNGCRSCVKGSTPSSTRFITLSTRFISRMGRPLQGMSAPQHKWVPFSLFQPMNYWTIKSRYTLSSRDESPQLGFSPSQDAPLKRGFYQTSPPDDRSAKRVINRHMLFEPFSKYSWLLVYQLVLAYLLRDVIKYIYRVQLRGFIVALLRSEVGVAITSPEFREILEHGPPRLYYTSTKRLQDVAAPEGAIPALSEAIWFLRDGGRARAQVRGLLIGGPSGAEKTSLVQAIAGEAQVPIVVQSLNSLLLSWDLPYERLENVFALARKKAPCVLFLDSLDDVGRSRDNVVRNDKGAADTLFSLDLERGATRLRFAQMHERLQRSRLENPYPSSRWDLEEHSASYKQTDWGGDAHSSRYASRRDTTGRGASPVASAQAESENRRIHILLQLLTEIDGVRPLNGVIIVATSERPTNLDPALLRPGRFDRIVHLQLPNHNRRIQIFKNETKRIGYIPTIPWDYFGIRTATWSAGDIVSAINHSAIRAILDDTAHTIETLEHGINCVTGMPTHNLPTRSFSRVDPFHTSRLAFYQAGKGVVQSLLLDHPQIGVLSLREPLYQNDAAALRRGPARVEQNALQGGFRYCIRRKGARIAGDMYKDQSISAENEGIRDPLGEEVQKVSSSANNQESNKQGSQSHNHTHLEATHTISSPRTRLDVETRLIGLYAGKASELLHISIKKISSAEQPPIKHSAQRIASQNRSSQQRDPSVQAAQDDPLNGTLSLIHTKSSKREGRALQSSGYLWQSNVGVVELLAASSLIHLAIDRWHLYSQKLITFKTNRVVRSLYREHVSGQDFTVLERLNNRLSSSSMIQSAWGRLGCDRQINKQTNSNDPLLRGAETSRPSLSRSKQERERALWWQQRICQELEMSERPYGRWYRLYLPKVEESERNEEWVPPDVISHQSVGVANLSQTGPEKRYSVKTINDLYTVERDILYHTLVMNCFYTAFHLLSENRELLDLFADHLIRFQILRAHDMVKICSFYLQPPIPKQDPTDWTDSASPYTIRRQVFDALG